MPEGEGDEQDQSAAGVAAAEEPRVAAPRKKAAAMKAVKKTSGKKAHSKRSGATQRGRQAQQAKFPRHSVEKALRISKAIIDQGASKPATVAEAAKYTTGGSPTGPFSVEV